MTLELIKLPDWILFSRKESSEFAFVQNLIIVNWIFVRGFDHFLIIEFY